LCGDYNSACGVCTGSEGFHEGDVLWWFVPSLSPSSLLCSSSQIDDVDDFTAGKGHRSFSPWTFTPGLSQSLYPNDPYNVATSNNHICIIPQIESAKGVENAEEIAAVEGISALFFGPGDYMIEAGMNLDGFLKGNPDPKFFEAMGKFTAAAAKNDVPVFG
jgi:4-hydroxy-2-oxoheptanedioate aldolase